MSYSWNKIVGTQLGKFILGLTGVTIKNNNQNLEVRNNDDSAFTNVSVKNVVLNNDADSVTIKTDSVTSSYTITLPPNAGTANQVLVTDGNGNLRWASIEELISNK